MRAALEVIDDFFVPADCRIFAVIVRLRVDGGFVQIGRAVRVDGRADEVHARFFALTAGEQVLQGFDGVSLLFRFCIKSRDRLCRKIYIIHTGLYSGFPAFCTRRSVRTK